MQSLKKLESEHIDTELLTCSWQSKTSDFHSFLFAGRPKHPPTQVRYSQFKFWAGLPEDDRLTVALENKAQAIRVTELTPFISVNGG